MSESQTTAALRSQQDDLHEDLAGGGLVAGALSFASDLPIRSGAYACSSIGSDFVSGHRAGRDVAERRSER